MMLRFDIRKALRWVALVYITVLCCPVEFLPISPDLDASWQLGLNIAADRGLRFGDDILWPSGPYAYLDSPQPIGNNLTEALVAQLALWLAAALAIGELIFVRRPDAPGLVVLMAAFAVGVPIFHFNSQGSDSLLSLIALLLAASAVTASKWRLRLTAAAVAAGLAGTMKLSAAVIGGSGVLVASLLLWRRGYKAGAWATATVCLAGGGAFLAVYLLHNPSFEGLVRYTASMRELSSGYSAAMSMDGPAGQVKIALAMLILVAALIGHLRCRDRQAASVGLIFAFPLLFSFKHGFVRQDSHIATFFCFAALAAGAILAYARWDKIDRTFVYAGCWLSFPAVMLMSTWSTCLWAGQETCNPPAVFARTVSGAASTQHLAAAFDLGRTRAALLAQSRELHQAVGRTVPEALQTRLGGQPVAVLSPQSTEVYLEGFDLRLLKVIQKYAAYTPALDAELARWLEEEGPDALLMQWMSIDGRHPMLETPRVWAAVWRAFDCVAVDETWALLRRRKTGRFEIPAESASIAPGTDGAIDIPAHRGPLFLSLGGSATFEGRLMQQLFRLPRLELRVETESGKRLTYTTFPGALASPIPLSPLPLDIDDFARMLAPDAVGGAPAVRAISLGGEGKRRYSITRVALASPPERRVQGDASLNEKDLEP